MGESNRISIFSVCDNHYVILLAALIKSIEVNHKSDEPIDFYVIDDNIRRESRKKLLASFDNELINIIWLKIEEIIPRNVRLPIDNSSFPLNIYARLFIPEFIPENLQKLLYLDVDMIVRRDISELWNIDIGDKIVGGVVDRPKVVSSEWGGVFNYKALGIPADTKYFNSGLLLINPAKWRNEDIAVKTINCVNNNIEFANYPDQYGLNVVFAGQWFEIEELWNVHSTSKEPDPYLIHFSGRKPIYRTYPHNEQYRQEFEKYSAMTKWSGENRVSETKRLLKKVYNRLERYVSKNY